MFSSNSRRCQCKIRVMWRWMMLTKIANLISHSSLLKNAVIYGGKEQKWRKNIAKGKRRSEVARCRQQRIKSQTDLEPKIN